MSKKQTRVNVDDEAGGDGENPQNTEPTEGEGEGEQTEDVEQEGENEPEEETDDFIEQPPKPRPKVEEFCAEFDAGAVDLAFTEHWEYDTSEECFPRSYFTLTGKERLLLLFAENFRIQFHNLHPDRRPLVLAIRNECEVQKLVCTTIRPTSFLYQSLVASLEGCASFVADFIQYEPLENPFVLPPRLMSPSSLIRCRRGNSFEMATLLCSMLIGAGFPAMVVSGAARDTTIHNDQRHVVYQVPEDHDHTHDLVEADDIEAPNISERYLIKKKPILVSQLDQKLAKLNAERERREKAELEETVRHARETYEEHKWFNDPYRRSHAWVMIVTNAPWSIKPRIKVLNEEGEEEDAPVSVQFIEPSTGIIHETDTMAYVHVESVWNNLNYYVNLQKGRIREMRWDLSDNNDWEHFLAGEPAEMRVAEQISDENLAEEVNKIGVEKHLDLSRSWVQKLDINEVDFDERYPNQRKAIYYKRVLHERFSSHSQSDGKMTQVTLYADDKYLVPVRRWTWYDNRSDLMTKSTFFFATGEYEDSFLQGRPDSLRYYLYNTDENKPKIMHFYSTPRADNMRYCQILPEKIILHFEKNPGKCFYKEFVTKYERTKLREITEKFQRNPEKKPTKDIAIRRYLLEQNKIHIKFHYLRGALTAWTREFIKPPKPDYGLEIIFNPDLTKGLKFGGTDPEPTQLEQYLLLLESLKSEEAAIKSYYNHVEELGEIIKLRMRESHFTILKFKCFDPLRNSAARKIRLEKDAEEKEVKKKRQENLPDFLAPYVIPYGNRSLTPKESWSAYNSCLNNLKSRFVSLLNELQRRYEDLTAEATSLKKFLNKFENKFDDFDYERMLQESKALELNKRMVQQRLTITHEEAQKKYDLVKQSLLEDPRLNLVVENEG